MPDNESRVPLIVGLAVAGAGVSHFVAPQLFTGITEKAFPRNTRRYIYVNGGIDANSVPLMTGDIIYVPRSSIAEVNLWIDQFINKVVPFQRSFSYTLGSYTTNTGTSIIP